MGTLQRIRDEAAAADIALAEFASAPAVPPAEVPPAEVPPAEVPPIAATPPPAPPSNVQPITDATVGELQQRLRSLEGMFNAEVSEKNQLLGRVEQLTRMVAAPPKPPAAPPAPVSLVTDEEKTEWGDEFLDVTKRIAQQVVTPLYNALLTRIERLEIATRGMAQKVDVAHNVATDTVRSTFEGTLAKLVPDWESVNTNKDFLDYLAKPDIFTGATRYELLQQALEQGNAERVAAFFLAFKSESGVGGQAPTGAKTPPATPAPANHSIDPRSQIAPSSVAPAAAPTSTQNGKIWSSQDISDVYDKKMKGRITQTEFARLEADIMKAVDEGRTRD